MWVYAKETSDNKWEVRLSLLDSLSDPVTVYTFNTKEQAQAKSDEIELQIKKHYKLAISESYMKFYEETQNGIVNLITSDYKWENIQRDVEIQREVCKKIAEKYEKVENELYELYEEKK